MCAESVMGRLRSSRVGLVLGAVAVVAAVVLVWLSVNALGPPEPVVSHRPADAPPPSEALPIALWSETSAPVVNLDGELRLGYEKRAGFRGKEATAKVVVETLDARGAAQPVLRLFVKRRLPEPAGTLQLGALLAATSRQQPLTRQLRGQGQLVITLGDRGGEQGFEPLSNDVAVPCVFRTAQAE